MRLHDHITSGNGYKVRLLLTQLGLPFERLEYDIDRGETRTPEFLATVNANGRIPVLEIEPGFLLAESNAILCYLGEGTRFVPDDRYARAQVLQWMFYEQYELEPSLAVVRFWIAYSGRPEGLPAERRDELMCSGDRVLATLDRHLDGRDYVEIGRAHV